MAKEMSREWLRAMGIEEDKIGVICSAHSDIVRDIVKERDDLKDKVADLDGKLAKIDTSADWKKLYTDLKEADDKKAARSAKEAALRAVYADAGIAEKYVGSLLRIADYDKVEVGKDGKAKNHDALVEAAKADNADFIPSVKRESAGAATPPANGAGGKTKMSKADIMKIADTAERQAALGRYIMEQRKGN